MDDEIESWVESRNREIESRNREIEARNARPREEAWQMEDLQSLTAQFIAKCNECGASRELSLAITNAEQALMWALKHVNERGLNK